MRVRTKINEILLELKIKSFLNNIRNWIGVPTSTRQLILFTHTNECVRKETEYCKKNTDELFEIKIVLKEKKTTDENGYCFQMTDHIISQS